MAKAAKEAKGLNRILLAIGLREYVKTASEDDIANVIASGVGMDEGESEGADASEKSEAKDAKGKDAKGNDARKRLHDALDRMLDSKDEEQEALDEDMEQLRGLLAGGASSEKSKNTSGLDEDKEEKEEEKESEAEDADEDEEEAEAEDEAVESEASKPLSESERAKSPSPSAVDGATVLKALKPFVAKSSDKRLRQAFDTASKLVHGNSKGSKGGYSAAIKASKAVGKDAKEQLDERERQSKIVEEANNAYAKRRGVNKVS